MTELLRTLYATTPGTSLHLDGDTVRIVYPDRLGRHLLPLVRLDHVVAFNGVTLNGVTLTDDLLHRCAADNRSVTWVTRNGRFLARTSGPTTGNPHLRLTQYRAHDNPEHRLRLARAFVAGKLHNHRQLLLRAARDNTGPRQTRLRDTAEHHATALTRLEHARSLDEVLGVEGNAAREYFQALDHLAPGTAPDDHPPTPSTACCPSATACPASPSTAPSNTSDSTQFDAGPRRRRTPTVAG